MELQESLKEALYTHNGEPQRLLSIPPPLVAPEKLTSGSYNFSS